MELNERLCRAILWDAWERARTDGEKDEMPPFPRPKMVSYIDGTRRPEHGFYRSLLYDVLPFYIKD